MRGFDKALEARPLSLVGALAAAALLLPSASQAAITSFGSPLSVAATLNTAENLNYVGTNTAVPPTPTIPNGVVHTFHFGADTALWGAALKSGSASAPATGQALKVSLEGCAEPAAGGPPPLTQIHFQDVTPLRGGGARVNLTSQPFEIPVCGQNGASGSTVTTYEPINLCVTQGDYVAFNDEGGYVENGYRAGVPYRVLGSVAGSTTYSFIKGGGTGDGAVMSMSELASMEGFATNDNEELMMQVTLGTGPDATHICPGGTGGLPPPLPTIRISPQTDGVNHSRIVGVAMYCRPAAGCKGVATMTMAGRAVSAVKIPFDLPGDTTSHLAVRVLPQLIGLIRKHHGVATTITAIVGGETFSQTVLIKIF